MKAIGSIIKTRRLAKGLTARQVAEMVGVSDVHVIYIENGRRRATFEKLANIMDVLGLSVDEVLQQIRQAHGNVEPATMSRLRRIPVVTLVTAGRWHEVCDSFEPGDADEWIETDIAGPSVFALRVVGDSMEPEFKEGEVITVNPHTDALPNDFVVVKNKQGEATFKQLKRYGESWVLHPLNPRYDDQVVGKGEFRIIGKVVKKERRY